MKHWMPNSICLSVSCLPMYKQHRSQVSASSANWRIKWNFEIFLKSSIQHFANIFKTILPLNRYLVFLWDLGPRPLLVHYLHKNLKSLLQLTATKEIKTHNKNAHWDGCSTVVLKLIAYMWLFSWLDWISPGRGGIEYFTVLINGDQDIVQWTILTQICAYIVAYIWV